MGIPFDLLKNRRPHQYQIHAEVIREAAKEMVQRLQWMSFKPSTILEVGYHLNESLSYLKPLFPRANYFAVNCFLDMLQLAKNKIDNSCMLINAFDNKLPLCDHSVDMVVLNLWCPWQSDIVPGLTECRRVLKPEGMLLISFWGPDTLQELKLDHSLNLIDMHQLGDLLIQMGFNDPVLDVDHIVFRYQNKEALLKELENLALVEPTSTAELSASKLDVTFEMIYGHAWGSPIVDKFIEEDDSPKLYKIPISQIGYPAK